EDNTNISLKNINILKALRPDGTPKPDNYALSFNRVKNLTIEESIFEEFAYSFLSGRYCNLTLQGSTFENMEGNTDYLKNIQFISLQASSSYIKNNSFSGKNVQNPAISGGVISFLSLQLINIYRQLS
ncbi:MAG: hypothetical protein P4L35_12875, partial [Ignavibacteriaceae bacterium]|nr:hypothetical protein [Ignavibacteriaceae bacterium]